jgi:hypothetical protein
MLSECSITEHSPGIKTVPQSCHYLLLPPQILSTERIQETKISSELAPDSKIPMVVK